MNSGMNLFSGTKRAVYNPDAPPVLPHTLNDEFNDGILAGWVTPAYDDQFNIWQTAGTVRMSERYYGVGGGLVMQGNFVSPGYTFYKDISSIPVTQPFTFVAKVHVGCYLNAADHYAELGIRGNADNVNYRLMAGRCFGSIGFRTVYANGGGAAQGAGSQQDMPFTAYLLISHDGSKNFSAAASGDGLAWSPIEINRSLSTATSFSRVSIVTIGASSQGITVWKFFRYFPVAGQFKIGRDV